MEPAKNAHNVAFAARFLLETHQYVDRERCLIWLCKRDAAELGVGEDKLARLAADAPEEDGRKGLTVNHFADLVVLQLRELGAELPLDWQFIGRKTDTPQAFREFVEALKRALQAVIEEYATAKDKSPDKAAALDVRRQLPGAEAVHVTPAAKSGKPVDLGKQDLDTRACGALAAHPGWTNTQIAASLGCRRNSLNRLPGFMRAREVQNVAKKENLRPGHWDKERGQAVPHVWDEHEDEDGREVNED